MKTFKIKGYKMKKFMVFALILALSLFSGFGSALALTSLPTLDYTGVAHGTESAGAVSLTLDEITTIGRANYLNGDWTNFNNTEETIIDATLSLDGAVNGDCSTVASGYFFFPAVSTMTITGRAPDYFVYMTAEISYLPPGSSTLFTFDGSRWLLYPPTLDATDPTLLNLSNIKTYTDTNHPSRYIDEINAALTNTGTSLLGMTMILTPQPESGTLCDGSPTSAFNAQGIIDGAPGYEPPVNVERGEARTIGYWKNHETERDLYIGDAVALSSVFDSVAELNDALQKKGKKSMFEKAKQQLSALLLNVVSNLNPAALLKPGELEILQLINPAATETATINDAVIAIESVINNGPDASMENAKDLADEINNSTETES